MVRLLEPYCLNGKPGWQDAAALSSLGFAYSQLGKLEQAKSLYQRWIEVEPDRAQPFYCLGYIYYLQQDWRQAIRWFNQALRLYPDYLVCLYRLAYAFYAFQKPKKSLPLLQRALRIYQENDDADWRRRNRKNQYKARFLLGKVLSSLREYGQALNVFQNLIADSKKHYIPVQSIYYEMGKTLAALRQFQEALRFLEKSHSNRNPQAYVLDQMGRVYAAMGEHQRAIDFYSRALRLRRFSYILVNRARAYLKRHQAALALKDYNEALRRDNKGRHKIYLELGRLYLSWGKLVEARHYFQQAIQFKMKTYGADYAEAHYALVFYHLKEDQKQKARLALQKALEINPDLRWDSALANELNLPADAAIFSGSPGWGDFDSG